MRNIVPGDVAWVLVSTVLVLLMTVPGLALFYAGMVRKKNVLAIMMQSFILCAVMTVIWMVAGYSLAFTNGNAWIGDFSRLFLNGIADQWNKPFTLGAGTAHALPTTIPESVFVMFQMAFAIITPAVVTGSCADRMKFSALLMFFTLWSLVVYAPLAHWVWSPNGWLATMGVADFAGGTVVEINCGVSGLICALMLGRRLGYGHENMAPWNLSYAVIGASLLWVGWMGFNSGGALGANARAGMAVLVTQVSAAGATLSWTFAEWVPARQVLRPGRHLRSSRRPRRHHPSRRLRPARTSPGDRPGVRCRLLLDRNHHESRPGLRRQPGRLRPAIRNTGRPGRHRHRRPSSAGGPDRRRPRHHGLVRRRKLGAAEDHRRHRRPARNHRTGAGRPRYRPARRAGLLTADNRLSLNLHTGIF
jgi:uncharacterized membrane protein YeaQ/YmgE (transglycosylase-associated protein family)